MAVRLAKVMKDSTMPDGKRYDGRFRLEKDIILAADFFPDGASDQDMADYYAVTLEEYLEGQKWADENLHKYRKDEEVE